MHIIYKRRMTVRYPNGMKRQKYNTSTTANQYKSQYINRGMTLEEDNNITNKFYLDTNKTIIYKSLHLYKSLTFIIQKEVQLSLQKDTSRLSLQRILMDCIVVSISTLRRRKRKTKRDFH